MLVESVISKNPVIQVIENRKEVEYQLANPLHEGVVQVTRFHYRGPLVQTQPWKERVVLVPEKVVHHQREVEQKHVPSTAAQEQKREADMSHVLWKDELVQVSAHDNRVLQSGELQLGKSHDLREREQHEVEGNDGGCCVVESCNCECHGHYVTFKLNLMKFWFLTVVSFEPTFLYIVL